MVSASRSKRRELSLEAAGLAISPLNKAHIKAEGDRYSLIEDLKIEIESTFVDFTQPEGSRLTSIRQYSNLKMSGMISNQNLFQLMEFSGLKNSRELYDLGDVKDADGKPVKVYKIKSEGQAIFVRTVNLKTATESITFGGETLTVRAEAADGAASNTYTTYYAGDAVPSSLKYYVSGTPSGSYIDPNLLTTGYKVYTKYTAYTTARFPATGNDPIPLASLAREWETTTEFGSNRNKRMSGIILRVFNDACTPIGTVYAAKHRVLSLDAVDDLADLPPGVTEDVQVSVFDLFGRETAGKTLTEVQTMLPLNSLISFAQYADLNKTCDDVFSASMLYSTQLANGQKINYEIMLPVAKFKTTNIPMGPSAKEQVKTSFEIQLDPIDIESLGDPDYLIDDTIFRALAANTKNPQVIIQESRVPCVCK